MPTSLVTNMMKFKNIFSEQGRTINNLIKYGRACKKANNINQFDSMPDFFSICYVKKLTNANKMLMRYEEGKLTSVDTYIVAPNGFYEKIKRMPLGNKMIYRYDTKDMLIKNSVLGKEAVELKIKKLS